MKWWFGTIIGSFFLSFIVYISRSYNITWKTQLIVLIPLILSNLGFWYGFRHAPNFINCWFLGTSINVLMVTFLGIIVFDKYISTNIIVGISFILLGTYLLIK